MKNIVKKTIALLLSVASLISLCACNSNKDKNICDDAANTDAGLNTDIILVETVEELGIDSDMLRAVTAVLNSDVIGYGAGNSISIAYYGIKGLPDNSWFYVYWVYSYLNNFGIYKGEEFHENEQIPPEKVKMLFWDDNNNEIDSYVPDFDTFKKIYSCLFGVNKDSAYDVPASESYDLLLEYLQEQPMIRSNDYGMKPTESDLQFQTIALTDDNENYIVEYHVDRCVGIADDMGNWKYEEYKQTITFKLNENSIFGFDVIDFSVEKIGSYIKSDML
ncbi:MAG: hypothetical protein ACI4KI_01045 [Candidatus Fimenecus sp.]